jgi:hypothetical protein
MSETHEQLRTWFDAEPGATDEERIRVMAEDPRWSATRYLVEATEYEKHAAWCFRAKHSPWRYDLHATNDVEWTKTSPGYNCQIGKLAGKSVCVNVQWDYLNGQLVCFWEAASLVVDYDMIEAWLKKELPNVTFTCNAQNLHNVLIEIGNERKK